MNTASPDDIDISTVWRSVRRALPKLILLSLLTGGMTYAALSTFPPRYTSEAQIEVVVPKDGSDRSFDSVTSRLDKEAINTHLRSVMSPDLALKIIAEEKLASNPEFNSALQPPSKLDKVMSMFSGSGAAESEQDRLLKAFFKRLEVYSPKESRVIGIRFTSDDPKLAADVANRLAETYRTLLATRSLAQTDDVQNALQPKIDKLEKEVAEAEAAVEHFRGQANIFKGGPNNTGLNQQQLGDITSELTRAQAARSEADARAQSVREMVRAGTSESLPDVQRSPLIQNLVQQRVRVERQLSELSATLLPAHPRMRQLRADLEGLQRQIKSEVGKIVEGIEKSASIAASREAAVRQSLEQMKKQVVGTGDDEVQLRQLEATAKSKRAELERLQARFEANRLNADRRAVPIEAQIVSLARPTSVPSFPKPLQYAVLIAMATLLFGIAIVVTRALFNAARNPGVAPKSRDGSGSARYRGTRLRAGIRRRACRAFGCRSRRASRVAPAGHRRLPHADDGIDGPGRRQHRSYPARQGDGRCRRRCHPRRLEPGGARPHRAHGLRSARRSQRVAASQGEVRGCGDAHSRQRRALHPGRHRRARP